jgi:16S rRNA (guanine966-N2)-methyltransferase
MSARRPTQHHGSGGSDSVRRDAKLRVIGGQLRGRTFEYDGYLGTRPMKDRVREAVFNLVGPTVAGKLAIDLFAGTGAMAFESLSRGADSAILIERRFPTCRVIRENAQALGLAERVRLISGDAFIYARTIESVPDRPWLVFVCPPYDFFVSRRDEMLDLIGRLSDRAPEESLLVVECDERFSTDDLPPDWNWDVRHYPPAVIALGEQRSRSQHES